MVFAQASVLLQQPITLDTGSGELFGSLLLPRSDAPVPVVLIVSGSGPTDRDGNNPDGGRTDSLKRLASVLASHNIASVRFDKRGVAASLPAAPDERTLSIEGYTADVVAWGEKLKADPRFGPLILLGPQRRRADRHPGGAQAGCRGADQCRRQRSSGRQCGPPATGQ